MQSTTIERQLASEVLPRVKRPQRYVGLELNRIVKPDAEVRWAIAFPDLYEIGMSWVGMQILYHRINGIEGVAGERVFLPEEDAASRFRTVKVPLPTLETHTPLKDVDVVGIDLSYEMALPGMLELLDLGGIPIRREDRTEKDPLVIIGGAVAWNPEPAADFIDLAVIGDGEEITVEIANLMLRAKRGQWTRTQKIEAISKLTGVYNPAQVQTTERPDGILVPLEGIITRGCTVPELLPGYYPDKPIVPTVEVTFDRIALEVMRGCTRGCRFCQAGMIYRPVRERRVEDLVAQAEANIRATGHNEISLLSLSTSDYSPLPRLIDALSETFRGQGISLAFPSLRPDSFTPQMAGAFPGGRKSTITFAPEAGTQRLRDIINKNSREEDLLRASQLAFSEGYNNVKLYFMIGLPGETEADLNGIVELAVKVAKQRARNGQKVTASISPFAPKPHTPFQRFTQNSPEVLREKLEHVRKAFRGTPVRISGHDPESSLFESALARGDRRLGRVIENVWRSGGTLEAWNDRFVSERWYQAFADAELNPGTYVAGTTDEALLPWQGVSKGLTDKFMGKELQRSRKEKAAPDCREGNCVGCGLTEFISKKTKVCNIYEEAQPPSPGIKDDDRRKSEVVHVARIHYRRGEELRWTGHLDMVRLWDRFLRRAEVQVAYSQGFHPHPRISFSPPLAVGLTSDSEYADIALSEEITAEALHAKLRQHAVPGFDVVEVVALESSPPSLAGEVERMLYGFRVENDILFQEAIDKFLQLSSCVIERQKGRKVRKIDLRSFVDRIWLDEPDGMWLLSLNVVNGATARLDELSKAWGLKDGLGAKAVRLEMYVRQNGEWKRPMEAVEGILSRSTTERAA